MKQLYIDEFDSPVGPLTIMASGQDICRIDYGEFRGLQPSLEKWAECYYQTSVFKTQEITGTRIQLEQYFNGERTTFSVNVDLRGTAFQLSVWNALMNNIPFGETRSYLDIAESVQAPKAVRAVGGAINKNPVAIVIPCHRVIGRNGKLVGYNGGLERKQKLLDLEKAVID